MQEHRSLIARDRTVRQVDGGSETAGFMADPPIFGVMHIPKSGERALLVCSPVYAEFMQNYGREVRLARRLADQHIATARFHYRGTGDSSGTAADITIDSMVADALEMAARLQEEAGVATVDVLGTRLGGHVAAGVAAQLDRARLVVWEPVPNVGRYFDEVFRAKRMVGVIAQDDHAAGASAMIEELAVRGRLDVVGYEVHKALFDSAHAWAFDLTGVDEVLLVQASRTSTVKTSVQQLAGAAGAAGAQVTVAVVPPGEGWWIHDYDEDRSPHEGREAERQLLDVTVEWLTG